MNKRKLPAEWPANCVGPLSPKQPKSYEHHSLMDDSDTDDLLNGIDFDDTDTDELLNGIDFEDAMEVDATEPDRVKGKENAIQTVVSPNHLFA